ncbi:MAG TPA: hypothetical protein VK582_08445 [Pyrinomonadaceae bacterium]|nr:hypothetical protein [Pyrinomonadaceae bacterium]
MNDSQNRKRETIVRVRDFGTHHVSDFAATSLANQIFTQFATALTKLDELAASQASGTGASREGTSTREDAREDLRRRMEAISRTARAIAIDTPGLEKLFRVPRGENDQIMLAAARAFAADAVPFAAQFVAHELPETFIDDLKASIANLEAAISHQSGAIGERAGSRAGIAAILEETMITLRKLDPIVRNKYADDPATLAEWTSASHIERAPKRKAESPSSTPPPKPEKDQ